MSVNKGRGGGGMHIYSCGGLCMAVYGHVVLWKAMYSCGGRCIAMEDQLKLWRAMYSYGRPCIAMEGHV